MLYRLIKVYIINFLCCILASSDDRQNEALYDNIGALKKEFSVCNVKEFIDYYNKQRKANFVELLKQFNNIPLGPILSIEEAQKPCNKSKNRYLNILPYDHSRVKLQSDKSDYINANFIHDYHGKVNYIAAQAPKNETAYDFLKLMMERKVPAVVMVTNVIENGKNKSYQYWPSNKKPQNINGITVEVLDTEQNANYIVRRLQLQEGDEIHLTYHFQFTSWPDHGCPLYATMLLGFQRRFRQIIPYNQAYPILVHCSAGVGRSGTFIVIDAMLKLANEENKVDVCNYFEMIRQDRMQMIQNPDQYLFVYNAIYESVSCGNTTIKSDDFHPVFTNIITTKSNNGKLLIEEEFYKLLSVVSFETAPDASIEVEKIDSYFSKYSV